MNILHLPILNRENFIRYAIIIREWSFIRTYFVKRSMYFLFKAFTNQC